VATAEFFSKYGTLEPTIFLNTTIILSVFIGTLPLTGSFIAFGKLQGFISGQPIVFKGQQILNAIIMISIITFGVFTVTSGANEMNAFYVVIAFSALFGITLTIPIAQKGIPVVISLLNSSHVGAASATGF
jgi:NAD/NADP transhydrogenase beta subunit